MNYRFTTKDVESGGSHLPRLIKLEPYESLDDIKGGQPIACAFCNRRVAVWNVFTQDPVTLLDPAPKPIVMRYGCKGCFPLNCGKAHDAGSRAAMLVNRRQNHVTYARLIDCMDKNVWRVEHDDELREFRDRIVTQGETLTAVEMTRAWDLCLGRGVGRGFGDDPFSGSSGKRKRSGRGRF
jgi:hypothetical protein